MADNSAFDMAASLILDSVEDVFKIVAPNGRERCHASIVNVLRFYTHPKTKEEIRDTVLRRALEPHAPTCGGGLEGLGVG